MKAMNEDPFFGLARPVMSKHAAKGLTLSRGEFCVANFISPMNVARLVNYFCSFKK